TNASDAETNASDAETNASDAETNASDAETNASDAGANASDAGANASDAGANAYFGQRWSRRIRLFCVHCATTEAFTFVAERPWPNCGDPKLRVLADTCDGAVLGEYNDAPGWFGGAAVTLEMQAGQSVFLQVEGELAGESDYRVRIRRDRTESGEECTDGVENNGDGERDCLEATCSLGSCGPTCPAATLCEGVRLDVASGVGHDVEGLLTNFNCGDETARWPETTLARSRCWLLFGSAAL
ncbi:MAG: hypothetical protein GY822_12660, partial [Deltaproteobacteria bacterium]|nr:hypothetical protein [Deltaproteobacteria bacterium]